MGSESESNLAYYNYKKNFAFLGSLAFVLFFSGITSATLFPDEPLKGLTFSVSDDFNEFILLEGTHFHSSTGHEFGNPEGKAEVGYFGSVETVRGLTEFDLTNLTNLPSVFLTFHVFNNGGLFDSGDFTNDFPFDGIIDVFAYEGNNFEDIDDYQKPPIYADTVGGFSTAALIVGDILSVGVTEIYNDLINDGRESLGFRLQTTEETNDAYFGAALRGAWTFDDFRLTTTDKSTADPWLPVPEPATIFLLGTGLVGLLGFGRKKLKR